MPHDKNGELLKTGDKVNIAATIESISDGDEYCNVTLLTDEVMYPSENRSTIVLNAKQVEKVAEPAPVMRGTQG